MQIGTWTLPPGVRGMSIENATFLPAMVVVGATAVVEVVAADVVGVTVVGASLVGATVANVGGGVVRLGFALVAVDAALAVCWGAKPIATLIETAAITASDPARREPQREEVPDLEIALSMIRSLFGG